MKTNIYSLSKESKGELSLNPEIFGLEVRQDIVKLAIDWQLAKARSGTHQTKTISEVSGTTKKPFKQKGTGNARQGSLRSCQMRGGGVSHGPVSHSHATHLNKKVRKLAMCHALSSKFAEGKLVIVESLHMAESKTSSLQSAMRNFDGSSFFVVDSATVNQDFALASRNLHNIVVVPSVGANVYDIIKHDVLMLTKDAVVALEARLKND
ncbi:MAG: 50S ribosomal protein L4 [Pseudomonadota bacterium]